MQRITLERQQVWIYLGATGLGLGAGSAWPALAPGLEAMLWPTLMLLLYATFVQVPLLHVREAFGDRRFVAAVLIGNFMLLARWMSLPPDQGRTLAFSLGTRNSFVVLPFALSLPVGWELAAVVIVVQSLVELLGMVVFLWWVPRHLFPRTAPLRQISGRGAKSRL